ncbi:MAG: choice-of-anchor I family protein [Nannocystaceae bacterium]
MSRRSTSSYVHLLLLCAATALAACGDDVPSGEGAGSSGSDSGSSTSTNPDPTTPGDTTEGPQGTTDAEDTTTSQGETESETEGTSTGEVEMMLDIQRIGRYAPEPLSDLFDEGAAEIAAFDPVTQSLFVTNGMTGSIDVIDLSDATMPTFVQALSPADPGLGSPTSVAVSDGVVAASVPSATDAQPGQVVFFDVDGTELSSVTVGALPDMVTFSPDGTLVLTANEGEPTGYLGGDEDPEGSVSIIDVSGGVLGVTAMDVSTAGFGALTMADIDATTRVFGPGSTIAEDLEPEYVAVSGDSTTAWVSLQENNALAIVDLVAGTVTDVVGLGLVDHSMTGLDASDQDDAIDIATAPVFGMRQPDAIAAFEIGGSTYVATANEGDARDYGGLDEAARISSLPLDATVFPNAADLQMGTSIGRLQVTDQNGDIDDDGDYDELWVFGSRSVSIFDAAGVLVWDSGDEIEQVTAAAFPDDFNCDNDENGTFESRSDNKGPEPEGLTVGEAFGTPYLFVGLERIGGFMVWDVSDPSAPQQLLYINPRDFTGDAAMGTADDLGPEGLLFIEAASSPTGQPLVVVTNEVSGTVSIYELTLVPV